MLIKIISRYPLQTPTASRDQGEARPREGSSVSEARRVKGVFISHEDFTTACALPAGQDNYMSLYNVLVNVMLIKIISRYPLQTPTASRDKGCVRPREGSSVSEARRVKGVSMKLSGR